MATRGKGSCEHIIIIQPTICCLACLASASASASPGYEIRCLPVGTACLPPYPSLSTLVLSHSAPFVPCHRCLSVTSVSLVFNAFFIANVVPFLLSSHSTALASTVPLLSTSSASTVPLTFAALQTSPASTVPSAFYTRVVQIATGRKFYCNHQKMVKLVSATARHGNHNASGLFKSLFLCSFFPSVSETFEFVI